METHQNQASYVILQDCASGSTSYTLGCVSSHLHTKSFKSHYQACRLNCFGNQTVQLIQVSGPSFLLQTGSMLQEDSQLTNLLWKHENSFDVLTNILGSPVCKAPLWRKRSIQTMSSFTSEQGQVKDVRQRTAQVCDSGTIGRTSLSDPQHKEFISLTTNVQVQIL